MTAEEAQRIALRTAAERFVPLDPTNLVVTRRRIWPFPVYWEVCTETPNGSTRITLRDRDGEWVYFGLRSRRQPLPKRYVLAIVAWLIVFSVFLGWAIYRFLGGTPKQAIFAAPINRVVRDTSISRSVD